MAMAAETTALERFLALREGETAIRVDSPPMVPAGEPAPIALDGFDERVEWRPLSHLATLADPWRELAARALEPNVFYEPAFALAAAPAFGSDAGVVLVWADTARQRLIGFFPARIAAWRRGFLLPTALGWTHPYGPLGTPLVDRDHATSAISAWLDFIARERSLPKRWLLPLLPSEGAFAAALTSALAAGGGHCVLFAQHQRALLAPTQDRAGYLDSALSAKKRKELARQRRRLAEGGEVATVIAAGRAATAPALEDFMTLERKGWKGRGGTAAAQDAVVGRFMREAVLQLAETDQARIARLTIGTRTLAAGILLNSGAAGWFWKIAYDEDAARSSPGVQLTSDITRAVLDDAALTCVDSCATAGHPMIDLVWRERLSLADHLLVVGNVNFALARTVETLRRTALDVARRLRRRLR
jgi:CelD/BcsL family acetyltransferase involved in cellulose biosynthesis